MATMTTTTTTTTTVLAESKLPLVTTRECRRERPLPFLPPELWYLVIASITDSRYLPRVWLNFRRVSRFFKHATESVFAAEHIPRSRLEFLAFDPVIDENREPQNLDFALDFDRFSEDGSRAIYTDKAMAGEHGAARLLGDEDLTVHDECVRQWMARATAYLAPPPANRRDAPPYVFVMRRIANDTELPVLEIDCRRFRASFEWRPAMTALFAEEEYRKWGDRHRPRRNWKEIIRSMNDGRMNRIMMSRAVVARLDDERRIAAKVRQVRIRRYYRRHGRPLQPGAFADADYVRQSKEVYALHDDLKRTFIGDEWLMGGEVEEDRGTFYDGMGIEFPQSEPEDEPDVDGPGFLGL
jgi:hypothetical protein